MHRHRYLRVSALLVLGGAATCSDSRKGSPTGPDPTATPPVNPELGLVETTAELAALERVRLL